MKIYQVDSFTNTPFKGNPAGVYISSNKLENNWMQQIATEMNLSETAFVYEENDELIIRFFTPANEVPICGHATLAAGHIMYSLGLVDSDKSIHFSAKSGTLSVFKEQDWYTLDFPKYDSLVEYNLTNFISKTGIQANELYKSENGWLIAMLDSEQSVKDCKPNMFQLEQFPPVIITALSVEYDYVLRLFAPSVGINEDPVTGSAECVLVPIWANKLNKTEFEVKQLSKRTGIKKVKLNKDRVLISGQAITIFEIDMVALI